MKKRLRRSEREAVRNKYASEELFYRMMSKGGRELERQMGHFRLSVEELFLEVMAALDQVKENPEEARGMLEDWWDTLYCDFRDLDTADSPEEELCKAVSEVVYVTMELLSMCQGVKYTRMMVCLMEQLTTRCPDAFSSLSPLFVPHIWKMGERSLKIYVRDYMVSDRWISDEIVEMLENLPEEQALAASSEDMPGVTKSGSTLTNRQLTILFEHLMNISLQSEYTNIKAVSQLLGEVSGRSPGSIRQLIMKGIDYGSAGVHADIDRLEALVRPISEKLADQIKNSKEEI